MKKLFLALTVLASACSNSQVKPAVSFKPKDSSGKTITYDTTKQYIAYLLKDSIVHVALAYKINATEVDSIWKNWQSWETFRVDAIHATDSYSYKTIFTAPGEDTMGMGYTTDANCKHYDTSYDTRPKIYSQRTWYHYCATLLLNGDTINDSKVISRVGLTYVFPVPIKRIELTLPEKIKKYSDPCVYSEFDIYVKGQSVTLHSKPQDFQDEDWVVSNRMNGYRYFISYDVYEYQNNHGKQPYDYYHNEGTGDSYKTYEEYVQGLWDLKQTILYRIKRRNEYRHPCK